MEPIFSMTNLQRSPGAVKEAAKESLVRITEQGGGSYVFCSEKALQARIAQEREDAAYEARLIEAVGRGIDDIEAGRFTTSIDDAFERADQLRKQYA